MSTHFIVGSHLFCEFDNGTILFEDLNFTFGQHVYGLVGPNGVGKTTLFKLLNGEIRPTRGSLSIRGTIATLPQLLFAPAFERQTLESLFQIEKKLEALSQVEKGEATARTLDIIGEDWDLRDRVQAALNFLGVGHLSLKREVRTLSGGECMKAFLARLLLHAPDIILLDEPSNNLDTPGRQALCDFIQNWKKCMIVVSHDRALLSYVHHVAELSNQGLQFYGGNYEFYTEARERESVTLEQKIATAKQDEKKQKKDLQQSLERQQRKMAQGKKKAEEGGIPKIMAGGLKRKAQGTLARLKDIHEGRLMQARAQLSELRGQIKAKNIIQVDMPETEVHSKKEILEISEFNFRYPGSSSFLFSSPISYHWMGPKRVSISGPNGSGKSTLIQALLNPEMLGERRGTIHLKSNRIAYLDQRLRSLGNGRKSLLELFTDKTPHLSVSERRTVLGRFLFPQDTMLKKICVLSGGERMRAALACALFSEVPPELLILDEPTNNLDIDSTEQIESALSHFRGAILVVSHDGKFLKNIGVSEEIVISA